MRHAIPKSLKLVILDCDGVMFDSLRSNVAYYNSVMERLGEPPLNEEGKRLCHVLSTPQLFAALYSNDHEKAKKAEKTAYAIDYLPFLEFMDPEPGLYETLNTLKKQYRVALATNRGKSVPALLKRFELEEAFETVSTLFDVDRPKPAPDLLLHCLEKTGITPGESIYVGDMENDRIAAEAAGISFVLKNESGDHPLLIRHLEELPGLLAAVADPS